MKKTMLRAVAGSSLCALALVGTAGVASAGEITGNGTYKGVNDNASECAYSGQNDGYHDPMYQEGPDDTARVQSYGQIVRTGALKGSGMHGIPGMACNKNKSAGAPE